jgi:hypothetical protein
LAILPLFIISFLRRIPFPLYELDFAFNAGSGHRFAEYFFTGILGKTAFFGPQLMPKAVNAFTELKLLVRRSATADQMGNENE